MTQQQSFFFDWNSPDEPTPVPITAQCETLQVKWSRQSATGPDPIAPYYFQVFTSYYIFPFQLDAGSELTTNLTIPFAPGTQYQICMFDSVGNTGGCQAVYTVYPAATSTTPTCSNWTMPTTPLDVISNFGQYSWIPSCSDLTLTPNSGTPPYEVTIAPALHPPYNISNVGSGGVSYKLPLQWGMPFFVSMVDSTGLTWSYGPLHAGDGDQTCLTGKTEVSLSVTIVSAVGALVLGAVLTLMLSYIIQRSRRRNSPLSERIPKKSLLMGSAASTYVEVPYMDGHDDSQRRLLPRRSNYSMNTALAEHDIGIVREPSSPSHIRPVPLNRGMNPSIASSLGSVYHVESFHPLDHGVIPPTSPTHSRGGTQDEVLPSSRPLSPLLGSPGRAASHIYVVHHDSGPAPVSIYADDGTEIVELPPVYSRPPPPGPSRDLSRERSEGESDIASHPARLSPCPTINTHIPSSPHLTTPVDIMSPTTPELCITPTGLIPPRGVPWQSDPGPLPEKSDPRHTDS